MKEDRFPRLERSLRRRSKHAGSPVMRSRRSLKKSPSWPGSLVPLRVHVSALVRLRMVVLYCNKLYTMPTLYNL
jgi:hypothetical protein